MRQTVCLLLVLTCLPLVALAQEDQRMITEAEAPLWRAVGRLNVAGNRSCTATLITPTEAITAAHCLFHPVTHHRAKAADIRFVPGQRRDSFAAVVGVTTTAILPQYQFDGTEAGIAAITNDLALLRLDRAILPAEADPFAIADWPGGFPVLDITGYGRDRPQIASIRQACPFEADVQGAKLMGCAVVPGLSGAPAMISGSQTVVAVVSASVGPKVAGEQALLVPIAPHLAKLRALLP